MSNICLDSAKVNHVWVDHQATLIKATVAQYTKSMADLHPTKITSYLPMQWENQNSQLIRIYQYFIIYEKELTIITNPFVKLLKGQFPIIPARIFNIPLNLCTKTNV